MEMVTQTETRTQALSLRQEEILTELLKAGHDPETAETWVRDYVVAEPGTPERFRVTDESSANWVLRKVAEAEDQMLRLELMFNAEIQALEARFGQIGRPYESTIQFFHAMYDEQLEGWAREQIGDGKKRSIALLHGVVGLRKSPSRKVIDNEELTIKYAEGDRPEAVKKSILVSKLTDDDMDFLSARDLAHVEPGEEKFYAKAELPGARTAGSEASS